MIRPVMRFLLQIWFALTICAVFSITQIIISVDSGSSSLLDVYADDNDRGKQVADQIIVRPINSSYTVPHGMKVKKSKRFKQCKNKKKWKKRWRKKWKKKCHTEMLDFNLVTLKIINQTMTIEQAIDALNQTGDYEYVEPDYLMHETAIPNDPLFSQQWGLNSTHETDPDIDAPLAWDMTTGDSNVVVAIIDGGVDYTHPDLAANMWTNDNEIPGDGIDNDLNGFVDDYYGIDTHNDDGDPMDDRGHGTHLAGIIGAVTNNGIGVAGVSWNTRIMAVKYLDENGFGSISDAIDAINYVIAMHDRGVNIKITNNSWGGRTFSQSLSDAIGALADKDILFVASAGNDVQDLEIFPYYPASYQQPNILVVGMHGTVNQFIVDSNTGESIVDISAPGEKIISTALVNGASVCQDTDADGYSKCTGTSMSTAYTSGVAALVKSLYPNDSSQNLIDRIVRSSKPSIVTTRFAIPWTGKSATGGIVDADGALAYNGMTASPRKIYIQTERPYELNEPIQISQTINLSSLSDSARTWSLDQDVNWIAPNQSTGTVIADQQTTVTLDLESEFDFGLSKGHITVSDLSQSGANFDVPVAIRTRLQTLGITENILDSPFALDEMGYAVDIDGDVAVVSAPGEAVNAAYGGSVYVFRRQAGGNWILEATLTASDAVSGNRFGHDVAISDNRIVVGSGNNDSVASEAGAAYVFEYQSGQWLETQKLIPTGSDTQNDLFGQAVAIDNDLIVIGAPEIAVSFSPGAELRRGSAYIFKHEAGQWTQQSKLLQPDTSLNQYVRFGAAVDVQDSTVVVSSLYHPDDNPVTSRTSGRVHSYSLMNGVWLLQQTIVPPETGVELFGYRVALNDEVLVISAPHASNELGVKVGSVFTYDLTVNGWELGQRITPPDIERDNVGFGISMDVYQNRLIAGAPSDGVKAINSGSVYAFQRINSQWVPEGRLLPESAYSFSQLNYGRDVALGNGAAVIGAGLKSASNIPTTGYLYEFPRPTPHLETLTVNNVGADWVNVNLQNTYDSMVAVCTPHYVNNVSPIIVRMQNVGTQSFDIKLQNPGDLDPVFAETVYCMAAEEGVWQLADGKLFEAKLYTSTRTAKKRSWLNDKQAFSHDFFNPILFGQVMSHNDEKWSVFWSRGVKRTAPVSSSAIRTGKHIGSDTQTLRQHETIGHMVFESGQSQLDSVDYQVMLTGDIVRHLGHKNNDIAINISASPEFAILTQSGMDGGDGSWPVLDGFSALSQTQLKIAVDEDQIADSERRHTTENVAFFTATAHLNVPLSPVTADQKLQ